MKEHVEKTVAGDVAVRTAKRSKSRAAFTDEFFIRAEPQELSEPKVNHLIYSALLRSPTYRSALLVLPFSLHADESSVVHSCLKNSLENLSEVPHYYT
jgi:hypothetical protein